MSSSFGTLFRITTFGESHGIGVGVVVDGCPPGVTIDSETIQHDLDRRRPGQSKITTRRDEPDQVEILSGVIDGKSIGTPIAMLVRNKDARPHDYEDLAYKYRPSHADYTYDAKYGIRAIAGGGRSSARETIGRVAAAAIAKQILSQIGVEIVAWVDSVKDITASVDPEKVQQEQVEASIARCPDPAASEKMIALIEATRKEGDSLGGTVRCVARGVPPGWGEPVFDKLSADLAKAVMSLPACKGFEIGTGFESTSLTGSQHNDPFYKSSEEKIATKTNHSGGIQGGISNGMPILLRAAFKPTSTIAKPQQTVDREGNETEIIGKGRHDPCVLPRAVPMVEAMAALVLADHALRQAVTERFG